MAAIPKDPMILLSYVNTQLRDFYPALKELCSALDIDQEVLEKRLDGIGFRYDEGKNQFL